MARVDAIREVRITEQTYYSSTQSAMNLPPLPSLDEHLDGIQPAYN